MNRWAKISTLVCCMCLMAISIVAQHRVVGYTYESGNRGYIQYAQVTLRDASSQQLISQTMTDELGRYEIEVNMGEYLLQILQDPHFERIEVLSVTDESDDVIYLKHELKRKPGYIFEITLAEADAGPDAEKFALKGAKLEVYNNTTREEVMVIESLDAPGFDVDLLKGNHYTILVSHEGYINKRMEALVDVQSCILCFEGVGEVRPGVSDNLTESNQNGTLLANVELDRAEIGQVIPLSGIYYASGSALLDDRAKESLDQLISFMMDNASFALELGSHTDAKGPAANNRKLSARRAEFAMQYLVDGGIARERLAARGYGESQLTNNCKDGVKCSDTEHAQNRRTEVKIIALDYPGQQRSLREIRNEEMIDEILAEISNTTVAIEDTSSMITAKQMDWTVQEEDDPPKGTSLESSESKMIDDMAHSEDGQSSSPLSIEGVSHDDQYSGFRIVIHFSRFALPVDHHIFSEHDDLVDYRTADANHLYMIGDYDSVDRAKQAQRKFSERYPQCYIVGFEDGVRVY